MVQKGKYPIRVRTTGELAVSPRTVFASKQLVAPTVLRQTLYKDGEKKVREIFEILRQAFSDTVEPMVEQVVEPAVEQVVEPVVGPEAGVDEGGEDEEAGAG
jgi:hypothetical protein